MQVAKLVAIVVVEDMIFPSVIHYPAFWILKSLQVLALIVVEMWVEQSQFEIMRNTNMNSSFQFCSLGLLMSPSLYPRMKNLPSLYIFPSNLTHTRVTHDMHFLFISK